MTGRRLPLYPPRTRKRTILMLSSTQLNRKSVAALGQWEQLVVETYCARYQDGIVSRSPPNALALIRQHALLLVVLFVHVWWADWDTSFNANAAVKSWKSHPVAEGMRQNARVDISRPHKHKSGKEAKERRVGELEE